jgi:hypothetical protein
MDLTHQKRKDAVKETETAREKGKKKTEQNTEANLSIASAAMGPPRSSLCPSCFRLHHQRPGIRG